MTSREVFDVMQKDVDRLAAFSYHKEKSLMSELRKSRREMVSQSYDYHTPNADYIIVLRCNRKRYVSRMRFAFIEESLEYVSSVTQGNSRGIVSYSVHLLHRYAERVLHDTSLPMRKILLKFCQNSVSACIYTDKDYFVSATEAGLCLGKYDHTRGIMVHRTFVSMDMLKEKQLSAWNKVERFVKVALDTRNKYGMNSKEFQAILRAIPQEMSLSREEAAKIYASYFEKEDNTIV